jgi:hypothetical protein
MSTAQDIVAPIDPILATYFYTNNSEKTKLNWFCYEYAYVLYSMIIESKALKNLLFTKRTAEHR